MHRRSSIFATLGLAAVLGLFALPAAAFQVVSTSPAFYALNVNRDTGISVTFDAPLNPATVSPASVIVRGQMSGRHVSNLNVNGATLTIDPQTDFFTGEIVTVNLVKTLAQLGGGGPVLTFGYSFTFTVRVLGGTLDLLEIGNWSTAPADVPYFIYGGDLNGDGKPDACTPNEDSHDLAVFLNGGNGVFNQHTAYPVGNTPSSCFGDDLDLDGDIDVATANVASSDMTVLKNNGTGTFTGTTYVSGATCRQVSGGDFDGDGDTDLVTTGFTDDTLNLFFNHGGGTFAARVPMNVSADPFPVRVTDMNADGRPDLVTAYQGNPRVVQVFLNLGLGTFQPGATSAVGSGAWDIYANDLNADGKVDILLVEALSNRLRILLGDGAGGFSSSVTIATGSFPLGVIGGDLDGDGDMDGVTADFSSADLRVFRNNGAGTFTLQTTLHTTLSGSYAWPHDLDGDGDLDLSGVDELNDRIYTYQNPGATGIGDAGGVAPVLTLFAPRPNPATTGAFIDYATPLGGDRITVRIFDAGGRLVRTLGAGPVAPGAGQLFWDGRSAAGRPVPAGTYFLTLDGGPATGAGSTTPARLTILR
jgi:hypothetical protein